MPNDPAPGAAPANKLGIAGKRPILPAESFARKLAGLFVLGQRIGELIQI
jgi:hypothetical protein